MYLKAVIERDGQFTFIQGLDLDYATQGPTLELAKEDFVRCLKLTVKLNKDNNYLPAFLKPAPPEVWSEMAPRGFRDGWIVEHADVRLEDTPFTGILFLRRPVKGKS